MKRKGLRVALWALLAATTVLAVEQAPPPPDLEAPPERALRSRSGLVSLRLERPDGNVRPGPGDTVLVYYVGWTMDGKTFENHTEGEPARFNLKRVIPGWTEGLQLMAVGEKRRLWIPQALAYKGVPGRPTGTLVFDVELVEVIRGLGTVPAPPDVAAPPADAERRSSGLRTKVLEPGAGGESPTIDNVVIVHFTGWTTDGRMIDSSVLRGEPERFGLKHVIDGWSEGLQMMVRGEKRRLWIPEELAYAGAAGYPRGMLVYDVELIDFE